MFEKNADFLDNGQIRKIAQTRVLIVGAGALGQLVAHTLIRMGFLHLCIVDGDCFEESNLNRQLYATPGTVGMKKVAVLREKLLEINPRASIRAADVFVDAENGRRVSMDAFMGAESGRRLETDGHILVDCVDDGRTKRFLGELAESLGICLVHGAVEGWFGQVSTVFPGDGTMALLYPTENKQTVSALMVTVEVIAAFQAAEVMKLAIGSYEILRHRIMYVDMRTCDFSEVKIK